jgi:hypothetical protein
MKLIKKYQVLQYHISIIRFILKSIFILYLSYNIETDNLIHYVRNANRRQIFRMSL